MSEAAQGASKPTQQDAEKDKEIAGWIAQIKESLTVMEGLEQERDRAYNAIDTKDAEIAKLRAENADKEEDRT